LVLLQKLAVLGLTMKCLYAKYYEDFALFSAAITRCLEQTHTQYKQEMDSLLTLQFQTFKKAQIMTA
jgi:hypothetical protein